MAFNLKRTLSDTDIENEYVKRATLADLGDGELGGSYRQNSNKDGTFVEMKFEERNGDSLTGNLRFKTGTFTASVNVDCNGATRMNIGYRRCGRKSEVEGWLMMTTKPDTKTKFFFWWWNNALYFPCPEEAAKDFKDMVFELHGAAKNFTQEEEEPEVGRGPFP